MERVEVGSQTFRGRRQTAGDGFFFFVQICFSWKLRNQYFILTSFIESKKKVMPRTTLFDIDGLFFRINRFFSNSGR
jgi:hypothetical protein